MSRPAVDLSLYLVLDPDLCAGAQGMIATALSAAQAGATLVQLRAPDWKKRALVECARALKKALDPLHVPLIVNDHADVCLAAGADGLHVGQKDLTPADARALIGPDKILGLSVNTEEELKAADVGLIDHFGIGPVFATATKKDAAAALGVPGLARLISLSPLPAVAIGGINRENAGNVLSSGVDGIAVVSAICGQHDPAGCTALLRTTVDQFRRHRGLE